MNFDFINSLRKSLEGYNLFTYSLEGIKILAIAFIVLKMIQLVLKNSTEEKFDYMQLVKMGGYICLVASGNYIVNLFEDILTEVNNFIDVKESDLYEEMINDINAKVELKMAGTTGWSILTGEDTFGLVVFVIQYIVFLLLSGLCKIADLSLTAAYLLQRIFIIELLKFLFPVAVVTSLWEKWDNMLISWVKRYFGMIILGIAYVGVINFTGMVGKEIMKQYDYYGTGADLTIYMSGVLIAVIVCFTVKVKLLSTVTNYIQSYFS